MTNNVPVGPERIGQIIAYSTELETGYIEEDGTNRRFAFNLKWLDRKNLEPFLSNFFNKKSAGVPANKPSPRVKFFENGSNCVASLEIF